MPPIFIGSTELTAVGDIKIGSTDVQAVYVGSTQIFPTAGGDPSITFSWDPENDQALPGGTTFTRATVAQEFSGTSYSEAASGAIRDGHRRTDGGPKGYIPEPAATNQNSKSDLANNTNWTQGSGGLTATDDGTNSLGLTQFTLDTTTGAGPHVRSAIGASTSGGTIYAIIKQSAGRYSMISKGVVQTNYTITDTQTGSVTEAGLDVDASLIFELDNGWYHSELRTSASADDMRVGIANDATPGQGNDSFTGANETILNCHIQYENTNFSTTPIEASDGSAATRNADVLDMGVNVTTEFSALLDLTLPLNVGSGNTVTLLGPDATAEDILRVDASWDVIMDDGGTPVTIGTSSSGARIKVSYGRDASGRSGSLDGATAVTGNAPGAGHVGDEFQLGCANSLNQSRSIHHLTTLYNEKKSDAELEALST